MTEVYLPNKLSDEPLLYGDTVFFDQLPSPHESVRAALEARVIGQKAVIDTIIDTLDASALRNDTNRPLSTFASIGPSGVGKTSSAHAIADGMRRHGGGRLIKVNSTEYSEPYRISSLLGASPGYVGREQKSLFRSLQSTQIDGNGTVVLFDEIEKGSEELHNLLLGILDDGELTDHSTGKILDFRKTIVNLTSNIGSKEISKALSCQDAQSREEAYASASASAVEKFKDYFSPELVGRLDAILVFGTLGHVALRHILDLQIDDTNVLSRRKYGVHVDVSEKARDHLVQSAVAESPEHGARKLRSLLGQHVLSTVTRYATNAESVNGTRIYVGHVDEWTDIDTPATSPFVFSAIRDDSAKRTNY